MIGVSVPLQGIFVLENQNHIMMPLEAKKSLYETKDLPKQMCKFRSKKE